MPKVSVIIPCYNQGAYLEEAVNSVLDQTFQDFEILVVDDGSTDAETIRMFENYKKPKTRVIRTNNQGLSAARNNGVCQAKGDYILPLDADDKIGPGYLEEAVRILDLYQEIGIVYCEASYFGVIEERWDMPEYSLDKILNHNVIFCTALFRKADWEAVGGYNINMVYGWEDWDFWLSLINRGNKVYRIPKVHFFYRIREASMVQAMNEDKQFFMRLHAILNHRDLYRQVAEINICARVAELFFDTGLGFNTNQVVRQIIFGKESKLEFDLSGCGNIRQLRFHPINAPAAIYLDNMELTNVEGDCRAVACTQSNAVWTNNRNWLFQDQHPWMLLDPDNTESFQKISIRLQYLSIGHEVYPEIIKIKEQEIEQRNKEIYEILHSKSWKATRPLRWFKEMWRA